MDNSVALGRWKTKVKKLKKEVYTLYLAYKDPRVPWYAKLLVACIVGYVISPIDLIPDFIPVLGYIDDLIIIPLGIALAIKIIPVNILDEYREKAEVLIKKNPRNLLGAVLISIVWILVFVLVIGFLFK